MEQCYLVLGSGLLSQREDGGHADSQMVATDIVELGVLNKLPDLRLLQVVQLVEVGSSQVGAQRAVVSSDDDTAAAGGGLLVVAVLGADTGLSGDVLEDLPVLVLSDAANVDGGVGGQNVLSTTGRVLCGTASNEFRIVVLHQVVIETHVLLLSQNGIIGLQAVLLEEFLITANGVSMNLTHPETMKS